MKKINLRLAVISTVLTIVSLAVLPRIPLQVDSSFLQLDSFIGGYKFSVFNGAISVDTTKYSGGMDISGGKKVVLSPNTTDMDEADYPTLYEDATKIIKQRISSLGAVDTKVYVDYKAPEPVIVVEYPAMYTGTGFVSLVSQRGYLMFKVLAEGLEWNEESYLDHVYNPEAWVETEVSGEDLVGVDAITGDPARLRLRFSDSGRAQFSYLAKNNIGKPIALYVDNSPFPVAMPIVSEDLAQGLVGDPIIGGNFDNVTAKRMSVQLGAGALPVTMNVLSEEDILPVIDIMEDGMFLFSIGLGLFVIFVYFIIKYRLLGVISIISVVTHLLLIVGLIRIVNIMITIPIILIFIISFILLMEILLNINSYIVHKFAKNKPRNLVVMNSVKSTLPNYSIYLYLSLLFIGFFLIFGSNQLGIGLLLAFISVLFSYFLYRTFIEIIHWEDLMYEK